MHDIEPYFNWRHLYISADDEQSPFYGREYSEVEFTNSIYNFVIHPQWDDFGSETLYIKIPINSKINVLNLNTPNISVYILSFTTIISILYPFIIVYILPFLHNFYN